MIVRSKAKITSKGQLTLPAEVRRALGVGPGDVIGFEVRPDGVSVTPERPVERFAPFAGRYRSGRGRSADEINRWLRELRGHNE